MIGLLKMPVAPLWGARKIGIARGAPAMPMERAASCGVHLAVGERGTDTV
jgi:hypothetical protein